MTYIVPEIALATRGNIVGILDLQEQNLLGRGGLLSVRLPGAFIEAALYDLAQIIARRDGKIVAYLLAGSRSVLPRYIAASILEGRGAEWGVAGRGNDYRLSSRYRFEDCMRLFRRSRDVLPPRRHRLRDCPQQALGQIARVADFEFPPMDNLSFLMHQALLCLVVSLQEYRYFFQRRSKQHDFVGVQQH